MKIKHLSTKLCVPSIYTVYLAGKRALERDQWLQRARAQRFKENKLTCVKEARQANHALVQLLRRIPPPRHGMVSCTRVGDVRTFDATGLS